jgi:hypothetical protein
MAIKTVLKIVPKWRVMKTSEKPLIRYAPIEHKEELEWAWYFRRRDS